MIREALSIPIESNYEKRMEIGEQFVQSYRNNCLRLLRDYQPEDKP